MICKKCNSKNVTQNGDKIICNDCGAEFEAPKKNKLKETLDFFIPIIIALIIAMLLKTFVFANAVVPTGSMLNTIHEGDRIIASRIEYYFNDPERYDIIIFKAPDEVAKGNEKEFYVKRVIGLPGEKIEIKADERRNEIEFKTIRQPNSDNVYPCGHVYINGEKLEENYLNEPMIVMDNDRFKGIDETTIPDDCYFLMGDNRNNSEDARYWPNQFINFKDIEAKAYLLYWPFSRFGIIRGGEYDKKE